MKSGVSMSSFKITKVGMLILLEADLVKAIEFYQKLGFKLKFHLKDSWAELQLGEVKFGLAPTAQELPERRTGIVLEVDDLKAAYDALKDSVDFLGEPLEKVHGIMVSFKDPGGNILDIYQPTPEKVRDLVEKTAKEGGCCKGKGEESACKCKGPQA